MAEGSLAGKPESEPSANLQGACLMTASLAGFAINDALMKSLADDYAFTQVLFLRGLVSSALLALLLVRRGEHRFRADGRTAWMLAVRIVCEIGVTFCFLNALFNMPLANATAILMVGPLAVTLGAALVLGETMGWRRYLAVTVGLLGALLIVQPTGDGFNIFTLSALAAVGFLVARDLITRRLPREVPSSAVALLTSVGITLAAAATTPIVGWVPVEPYVFVVVASSAVCIVAGLVFGVMGMRVGDVGFVSPFRYTALLWALLLGAVVFGEFPDTLTLLGSTIVVATGVYTLHREHRRRRQRPALNA